MYGTEREPMPGNVPKLLGNKIIIRAYINASFAGCKITRRSRTGFIVYINSAPIYYMSKKQGLCEKSTFGSEFVAMKQCCEYLRGLRYKLRMMDIPVTNSNVLQNSLVPDLTLKKKSFSIAYRF